METVVYTITDPVGLHARPAAVLARFASELSSDVKVRKCAGGKEVDAKSMLAVMQLGVRTGDEVAFTVAGDAEVEDARALSDFCVAEL